MAHYSYHHDCVVCGKGFDARWGAKTCGDTCRKRYSRMEQELKDCIRTAENALRRAQTIAKKRNDLVQLFNNELDGLKDTITSLDV